MIPGVDSYWRHFGTISRKQKTKNKQKQNKKKKKKHRPTNACAMLQYGDTLKT